MHAAKLFEERGCKVVGISDVTGAYYNADGIYVNGAMEHAAKFGTLEGFKGGEKITNAELLASQCDVLVPAALEKVFTAETASKVQAKLIVEGANGPTTPEADRIFRERGVIVIPDIMANAGGVTVSYFEWAQDRMGYFWKEAEVNERLEDFLLYEPSSGSFDRQLAQRDAANGGLYAGDRPRRQSLEASRHLRLARVRLSSERRRAARAGRWPRRRRAAVRG